MELFGGFGLVEPGLVSLPEWRPDFNTDLTPSPYRDPSEFQRLDQFTLRNCTLSRFDCNRKAIRCQRYITLCNVIDLYGEISGLLMGKGTFKG